MLKSKKETIAAATRREVQPLRRIFEALGSIPERLRNVWAGALDKDPRQLAESRASRRRGHARAKRRPTLFESFLFGEATLRSIVERRHPLIECLESRVMLTGGLVANNDNYVVQFNSGMGANVLANDVDPNSGATLMAHLVSGPSHANNFQLPPSGSFYYVPATGYLGTDSFTYYFTDNYGYTSNTATVSLPVEYSVNSSADLTKQVAIDPLDTSVQILDNSSGAPATPQNLSLAYDSVAGQPDAVIEATFQMSSITPIPDTPSATLTFNGVQQPATYVNLEGMGNQANVDISEQVDTSGLATGRYPYSLTLNSPNMTAPATISGAVNVINDSSGPVGKGWDISGLYHLYQNDLRALTTLRNLSLDGTLVTRVGVEQIREALPSCKISAEADLPSVRRN